MGVYAKIRQGEHDFQEFADMVTSANFEHELQFAMNPSVKTIKRTPPNCITLCVISTYNTWCYTS